MIGFFESLLQLHQEGKGQAYGRLWVLREHRDGGPFGQRCALKDYFAFDHGTGDDLHAAMVLPRTAERKARVGLE